MAGIDLAYLVIGPPTDSPVISYCRRPYHPVKYVIVESTLYDLRVHIIGPYVPFMGLERSGHQMRSGNRKQMVQLAISELQKNSLPLRIF